MSRKERFFQPDWKARVADNLAVVKGDMFCSRMQTLTITVNCVGVMGKGLALTAKDRFPDIYVRYQDLCKKKQITPGKPCLYKRESSVFDELYDEDLPIEAAEDKFQTWFLFFPTKNHWRNKSNIGDIERGLQWLVENYQVQGIQSLAVPALGCGLGGLDWFRVGPLMCKYLVLMKDIQVVIYLPIEREIPSEHLTPEFLLSQVDF
ncbi:MAG: macro domain-containing protein [Symploca sp. SIO2D2]|nr:macro domain-containing protein [Symploca sp. SIO2D2]